MSWKNFRKSLVLCVVDMLEVIMYYWEHLTWSPAHTSANVSSQEKLWDFPSWWCSWWCRAPSASWEGWWGFAWWNWLTAGQDLKGIMNINWELGEIWVLNLTKSKTSFLCSKHWSAVSLVLGDFFKSWEMKSCAFSDIESNSSRSKSNWTLKW